MLVYFRARIENHCIQNGIVYFFYKYFWTSKPLYLTCTTRTTKQEQICYNQQKCLHRLVSLCCSLSRFKSGCFWHFLISETRWMDKVCFESWCITGLIFMHLTISLGTKYICTSFCSADLHDYYCPDPPQIQLHGQNPWKQQPPPLFHSLLYIFLLCTYVLLFKSHPWRG